MMLHVNASVGRGLLFVSVAAVTWGTSGAVAAILYRTTELGPVAVSFWRFACGAVILAAARMFWWFRSGAQRPPRYHRGLLVFTGICMALYHTAYFGAVAEVGVAVATVVTLGAAPVVVAVGSRLMLGERLGRGGAAMVTVAVAALVLLTSDVGASGPRPVLGCVLALLATAGYAAITLVGRVAGAAGDPSRTALAGFGFGAVLLLPLAAVEGIHPYPAGFTGTAGTVAWLLYLGLVPTAAAYSLFFAGLAAVRATTASVVVLLEPVTAAVIAVAILREHLTPADVAAMITLLGAVAALAGQERKRERRAVLHRQPRGDVR